MTRKAKTEEQPGVEDVVLGELLDELEIRQRMAVITRRLPIERKRLYDATIAYRQRKYRTWLAICFLREDLLVNEEAKAAVLNFKLAIAEGKSKAPIEKDKEALISIEMGDVLLERELAEMDVKASEADFDMLSKQLSWYQSVMKNNGPYVPIENSIGATYDAFPEPQANWQQPEETAPPLTELPKITIPELPDSPIPNGGTVRPSASPIARTLNELVTAKQLGFIWAICRDLNADPEEECMDFHSCATDELSKRAASDFIQHLQQMQKDRDMPVTGSPGWDEPVSSVAGIYGGPKRLSDVRSLDPDVAAAAPPPTQYVEPDGTKTNKPDGDVPF